MMKLAVPASEMLLSIGRLSHLIRQSDLQRIVEHLLETAGDLLEIDRLAYFRPKKDERGTFSKQEFLLARGSGRSVPLPGTMIALSRPLAPNKLVIQPTSGMGWDAFYHFDYPEEGFSGMFAFDDTRQARSFSADEALVLERFVNLFIEVYLLKKQYDVNKRRADHDNLTGLPNQRRFIEVLSETVKEIMNGSVQQASLAVIDIDHFKRCNDQHGHQFGDRVLSTLGELIRQRFDEKGSFAARYGGEEFVVLSTSEPGVFRLELEGLAKDLRRYSFGPGFGAITFSGGVTLFDRQTIISLPHDQNLSVENHIFGAADEKLYQAKAAGRDCLVE